MQLAHDRVVGSVSVEMVGDREVDPTVAKV
jgi:hypothetical protein